MEKYVRGIEKLREFNLKLDLSKMPVRFERIKCFSHLFEIKNKI